MSPSRTFDSDGDDEEETYNIGPDSDAPQNRKAEETEASPLNIRDFDTSNTSAGVGEEQKDEEARRTMPAEAHQSPLLSHKAAFVMIYDRTSE